MNVLRKMLPHSHGNQRVSTRKTTDSEDSPNTRDQKLKQDNYKFVRTLGTGSFGRVFLCKSKNENDKKPVAIKRLKKAYLIKQKQVDHIMSEKKILSSIRHPFVVEMIDSFKNDRYLFLVMEFVVGGEFFTHLRKCRRFEDSVARFYAAQIACIFEYLHSLNVVYRDLKPENILVAADGYLKLTDFGFAKTIQYRTYTLCGTPEYIAPEVLLSKGHGKPVDWWTLGILIFEMIVGYPPFIDDDPMGIYQKILAGRIVFPKYFERNSRSLVKRLLTHDLAKRYGNLKHGAEDVKRSKWFDNLSFEKLLAKEIEAPFRPAVKSSEDTSYFDEYPESTVLPPPVVFPNDPFVDW